MYIQLITYNLNNLTIPSFIYKKNKFDIIILCLQEILSYNLFWYIEKEILKLKLEKIFKNYKIKFIEKCGYLMNIFLVNKEKKINLNIKSIFKGMMPSYFNKGCIISYVEIIENKSRISFCLVNLHLQAHYENNEKRYFQFQKIIERIKFCLNGNVVIAGDFNTRYWYGGKDINYKVDNKNTFYNENESIRNRKSINLNMKENKIIRNRKKEIHYHKKNDYQMRKLLKKTNFQELKINFSPTYHKQKKIGYCDRIIFTSIIGKKYYSKSNVYSDHKPVFLEFFVDGKIQNIEIRFLERIEYLIVVFYRNLLMVVIFFSVMVKFFLD